ncbi:hypothetical protein SAMN04488057_105220 [Cyclobacterium lianum]|uniref:Spheroidene monooxygenase n=1 Tax=Cyclobacterium lianum TaxID=388280 RepID=A0A1M7NDA3_9BACT|nr:spheroidene monooxygenase [Cyclobacterium lianum]SHN01544.1 hypothetical protein SAMN04488057_105220 [Cyclobacterium lianum]
MQTENEIVSITFFEYPKRNRWWAFNQMQLAIAPLKKARGVKFFKLMGTGGGSGFSLKPDLKTYALLMVWENQDFAKNFTTSDAYLRFNQQCKSNFTYWMQCIQSHGTWHSQQPFSPMDKKATGPVMVITRARLKWSKVLRFLTQVPAGSRAAAGAEGLIYTKGIGEWPAIEQATFSYWKNQQFMENFAYQSAHRDIVRKVKKEHWYQEELFARFVPVSLDQSQAASPRS